MGNENVSNTSLASSMAPVRGVSARTRMLLEAPIIPTLLRLAAPNVLNLLAFAGMITFDGFVLGRISTNALAGASLAFPWVMLILQTTNSGVGVGVSSAVSRALGADLRDRADDLVFHAFLLALALGTIFSAVVLLGAPFLFQWMGGRDEMLSDALAYANVALGGAVCMCVLNLLGNTVRGTGNMTLPAAVLVACVLAHIAISPVLIFGLGPVPPLGPAGAGWGLVIPFGVGSVVMIGCLRSGRSIVRLKFHGVMPQRGLFIDILKVGVPDLLNTAVTNLSVAVPTGIAGQLGPETAIVALACGTIGAIVAIHPALCIDVFSDRAEVARIGVIYLHVVAPAYFCFGLGLGLFFVTQGVGRAVAAMNANAVRMIVSAGGGLVASMNHGQTRRRPQRAPLRAFFAAARTTLYEAVLPRGAPVPAIRVYAVR